jgi:hypothetical protein
MVPALCQRRAIGYMDHFVFGTSRIGTSTRVLAGTWVLKGAPPVALELPGARQGLGASKRRNSSGAASENNETAEGEDQPRKRRKIFENGSMKLSQDQKPPAERYEASPVYSASMIINIAILKIRIYNLGEYALDQSVQVLYHFCSCEHLGTSPSNTPPRYSLRKQ